MFTSATRADVPTNTADTPPNPPAMNDFTLSAADETALVSIAASASVLCHNEHFSSGPDPRKKVTRRTISAWWKSGVMGECER